VLQERRVRKIRLLIVAQAMRNAMSKMQTIRAVLQAFVAIHAVMAITTQAVVVKWMNVQMAQCVVMVRRLSYALAVFGWTRRHVLRQQAVRRRAAATANVAIHAIVIFVI
jgi:hypothetical protein